MMNQRTATVSTLLQVLKDRGKDYVLNGEVPIGDVLDADDKKRTRDILFQMFRNGEVSYKEDFAAKVNDDGELKKYISGLVNNWIRKAKELNCGQAYQAKNPGSRAGSGDEQVREMRKLLKTQTDPSIRAEIQAEIDSRLAEIKPKQAPIKVDALPEHLRHLVK